MKHFAILLTLAACASVHAQWDVIDPDGTKSGTAIYEIKSAGGKITSKLVLDVKRQGGKFYSVMTSVHTSAGDPISYIVTGNGSNSGSSYSSRSETKYSGQKATVSIDTGGRNYKRTLTSPGTFRDVSMIWLTGKVPKVGTKTTYYQVSQETFTCYKQVTTYHGVRELKVGGKKVSAHVVVSTSEGITPTKIYFGPKGELYRLETGPLVIVKR